MRLTGSQAAKTDSLHRRSLCRTITQGMSVQVLFEPAKVTHFTVMINSSPMYYREWGQ